MLSLIGLNKFLITLFFVFLFFEVLVVFGALEALEAFIAFAVSNIIWILDDFASSYLIRKKFFINITL
jgi:hypothetical protein